MPTPVNHGIILAMGKKDDSDGVLCQSIRQGRSDADAEPGMLIKARDIRSDGIPCLPSSADGWGTCQAVWIPLMHFRSVSDSTADAGERPALLPYLLRAKVIKWLKEHFDKT